MIEGDDKYEEPQRNKTQGRVLVIFCHFFGAAAGWKGKHFHIPLWCEITCDNRTLTQLLIESRE